MSADAVAFDSVLDLCRHQHRRIVLGVLAAERRPLTRDELTEAVLAYNHGTPLREVSDGVAESVRVSLHHEHLPKLAAEGLVEYDREGEVVELTERFYRMQSMVDAILDADPELEPPVEL